GHLGKDTGGNQARTNSRDDAGLAGGALSDKGASRQKGVSGLCAGGGERRSKVERDSCGSSRRSTEGCKCGRRWLGRGRRGQPGRRIVLYVREQPFRGEEADDRHFCREP